LQRTTAAAILALLLAPAALAGPGVTTTVGGAIEAGEFLAYRVRVPEGVMWEWALLNFATSDEAMVPLVAIATDPAMPATTTLLAVEGRRTASGPGLTAHAQVEGSPVVQRTEAHEHGMGVFALFLPHTAGDHDVVLMSGPAGGEVQFWVSYFGDGVEVLAEQRGRVAQLRTTDAPTSAEVRLVQGPRSDLAAAWASGPASLALGVQGAFFGYAEAGQAGGGWTTPAGEVRTGFLAQGAAGAWEAQFPPDARVESCPRGDLCATRPYPAFALGADVRLER
jgi:hypothetical protein